MSRSASARVNSNHDVRRHPSGFPSRQRRLVGWIDQHELGGSLPQLGLKQMRQGGRYQGNIGAAARIGQDFDQLTDGPTAAWQGSIQSRMPCGHHLLIQTSPSVGMPQLAAAEQSLQGGGRWIECMRGGHAAIILYL